MSSSPSALVSIDPLVLAEVTGGKGSGSSTNIDGLLDQLSSITSSIKDIKTKTNGLSSTEMLMLVVLAARSQPSANVVYVGARRPGCWW